MAINPADRHLLKRVTALNVRTDGGRLALNCSPISVPSPRPEEYTRGPVRLSGPNVPDSLCQLIGLDAGVLRVKLETRIADASPLTVSFDHIQLSGVVTGCEPLGDDWAISIALTNSRRREVRLPVNHELTVGIVRDRGSAPSPATVINLSPSGFCLSVSHPITVGSRIYIEAEAEMILGEVRHCYHAVDRRFIIGVMIVEVVPDVRTQSGLTVFWDKLRWRLASKILGTNPLPRSTS